MINGFSRRRLLSVTFNVIYFIASKYLIMFTDYESIIRSYIQMLYYINPAPNPSCRTFCRHKDPKPDLWPFWMNHEWFGVRLDEYPHVISVQLICKHNIDFTIFMKQFLMLGFRVLLGSLIQLTSSRSFYVLSERLGRVSPTPIKKRVSVPGCPHTFQCTK